MVLLDEMMFRTRLLPALLLLVLVSTVLRSHAIVCDPLKYPRGYMCCYKCPPGSRVAIYCTESYSTRCLPCTEGTFMDQETDHRQCYPCTKCDAGSGLRTETSCTNTSDAVCQPLEGFFCIESAEGGCAAAKRHTSCKPGEYISQNGSSVSDTVCSPCPAGSFSDGMFPSCRPHTQCEDLDLLLRPGTESADAHCGRLGSNWHVEIIVVVGLYLIIAVYISYVLFRENFPPK